LYRLLSDEYDIKYVLVRLTLTTNAAISETNLITDGMKNIIGYKADTRFAPAVRTPGEDIIDFYDELSGNQILTMIMDAMPDVATILSPERQIVYANKALLEFLSDTGSSQDEYLGDRPGELLRCIHSSETSGGCGTTDSCRFCGAVNSIIECQRTGDQINSECRITANFNGKSHSFDLHVTATPFPFNGKRFVIFAVKDISDQKRRRALEKMFFHDVLNTATGLNGMLYVMREAEDPSRMKEFIEFAEKAAHDLVEDILAQRALSAAESGDLVPNVVLYDVAEIMRDVAAYLKHHKMAEGKAIWVEPFKGTYKTHADTQLLKRVLINLVKNALEASFRSDTVIIKATETSHKIIFSISNPGFIPEAVRQQIFQRSFSTKGIDRGLGTYSVQLLTTKYLGGEVSFKTDESNGTTFTVSIPLMFQ
jgi:nitrogen-specific signal transduction histidine kinase